jgi:hypothetical protein
MDEFEKLYRRSNDPNFVARYEARCHCGEVRYSVSADPVDAKICHCAMCQRLHGAPMQWAAIFHKHHVRFDAGFDRLRFFNGGLNRAERILPCKVSCALCGSPIADEGRNMWLGFPPLFDFGHPPAVPEAFRPKCHIFYANRVLDMNDGLPKWAGHSETSARLD